MTDTRTQSNGSMTPRASLTAALLRLDASALPCKARLADRMTKLADVFAEDYDGRDLSARSAEAFVTFLAASPNLAYPDITATPAGDLYAEWRGQHGRLLTIEFLESGEARYLIFRPNPKHPQRVDRLTGTTTADALEETVVPLAQMTGLAA